MINTILCANTKVKNQVLAILPYMPDKIELLVIAPLPPGDDFCVLGDNAYEAEAFEMYLMTQYSPKFIV